MLAHAADGVRLHSARHHVQNLAFGVVITDWPQPEWEIVITEAVMRATCLRELDVQMASGLKFNAATVIAWLLHTRKTLTSLRFVHPIEPRMSILEKLGGMKDSKLEQLFWGHGYITTIDPATHRFESLVSLSLYQMENAMAASNLRALLSVCPKLERLTFTSLEISGDDTAPADPTLEIRSSSLKSLDIIYGFCEIDCLILHTDRLESMSLFGVAFRLVKLVEEDGRRCGLQITGGSIAKLQVGDRDVACRTRLLHCSRI